MNSETIYDISEIPLFPFIPGLSYWFALLIFGLILALIFFSIKHSDASRKAELNALGTLLRELRRLTANLDFGEHEVSLLSRLIRNYLSLNQKIDLHSMCESELRALGAAAKQPLSEVVSKLCYIESLRYNPQRRAEIKAEIFDELGAMLLQLSARDDKK